MILLLFLFIFFNGECLAPTPTTHTVTLDANNGTFAMTTNGSNTTATVSVELGKAIPTTTPVPTRTNYTLQKSWNTKKDESGTKYVFGETVITEDVILYAIWTQNKPAPPIGLTTTVISSSKIDLIWAASANATYYILTDNGSEIATNIEGTSYSHTGLAENSTYSYTLKACNTGGCSEASAVVSATTSKIEVTAVEHPRGKGLRDRYGVFKISASESIKNYRLVVKKKSEEPPTAAQMESGAHYKRNINTTEIYILISNYITAYADLLDPKETFILYGMKENGTPILLVEFTTDSTITSTATGSSSWYMDESISKITLTARVGDTLYMPVQLQFDIDENKHLFPEPNEAREPYTINFYKEGDVTGLQYRISSNSIVSSSGYDDAKNLINKNTTLSNPLKARTLFYEITPYLMASGKTTIIRGDFSFSVAINSNFPPQIVLWNVRTE